MDLLTPISELPRTSPRTIQRFEALGIKTYKDLLHYYPFRYEDYSNVSTISRLQEGETVTVKGTLTAFKNSFTKRGFKLQKGTLTDATGSMEVVWYNQMYLTNVLHDGLYIAVAGQVERFGRTINMKPTEYEVLRSPDAKTIHTGRLVPVYSTIYGVSSKTIREKVQYVLSLFMQEKSEELEFIPHEILEKFDLLSYQSALAGIHEPDTRESYRKARKRLAFNELFIRVLSSHLVKEKWKQETITRPIRIDKTIQKKLDALVKELPFELTSAQTRTTDEILSDLKQKTPMNRFVQGDVGSGKTVVAAIAAYATYLNRLQTLIMAPTEILAQQHYKTVTSLINDPNVRIGLQTGSKKSVTKKQAALEFDIVVGTQALITQSLNFDRVGLVVIDEQHRFGVKQRAMLKDKGINPHLLTMTATPIPRTVSLTLYSELDLSVIDEMPKGRKPIKTYVTPQTKRDKGNEWIKKQIKETGSQVYIICPLVEESESETMKSVRAVTVEYEHLKSQVFKDFKVALLHGKMKSKEKEQVMDDFKARKYDILVSTSVVEVGVDVPNATIMLIEGAERFGLAQLHQLRGRVGRSDKQSYCFLFTSTKESENTKRLQYFSSTNSGMKLAEYDLKLRGPGDLYGTQQSGYTDLQLADITNYRQVHDAQDAVQMVTTKFTIQKLPKLQAIISQYQLDQISRD